MNRAKLQEQLKTLADEVDEIAAILADDAQRIRQVAQNVRTVSIAKSRAELGPVCFLDGDFNRDVPNEICRLRPIFTIMFREDMRPNKDQLSTSKYNHDYS